ncbi:MAG: amino acid adenylation domain-containing protein, partial [Symploca sp. SIO2D2]|nr:amino acid adenylation domain-containing protein [Symploca sp. SIO2D2]
MNLIQFLQDLSLKGVKLWSDGGKLRTGGSQEVLTTNIIAQLKQYKSEILQLLRDNPDIAQVHPLSYGQKGLWFLWQLAPQSHNYNVSFSVRIYSKIDITTWQQVFQALRARHPLLRSTFPRLGEQPIQQLHQHQELDFLQIDASSWSEEELHQKVVEAHRHPFKLETEAVMRVRWFTCSEANHIMLLTIHHIALDGWSCNLIAKELPQLYQAQQDGVETSLPPLNNSYQDYVCWQKELVEGQEGEQLWNYWQQKLGGELPVLNLPTDRPRPPIQTDNGGSYVFKLSEKLTQQLKELAQTEGATLYMTLLATFQVLLYRYTGQEDILVGSPTSGRTKAEFASIVGYFVDSVVMRADLSGNLSFRDFLAQVRQTVLGALDHQDYPFALLVEKLQIERDSSRSPLFQACFVLQKFLESQDVQKLFFSSEKNLINWGRTEVEPFVMEQYESQYDLLLEMLEEESSLVGLFKYNADLFDEQTIARMTGHFQNLLEGMVNDPQQRVTALPLMTKVELNQILVEWNSTKTDYPTDKCIHELFEEQVQKTPNAIAVVFEEQKLTYSQLNSKANQLAHYLQKLGVVPETLVGICVERSVEMIVGLLAILKAGGAYVPLDPNYPPSRLNYMIEDAQLSILLTQQKWQHHLSETRGAVICLDTDEEIISQQSQQNLENQVTANQLAYVIYTSGSTGKPKGVTIPHQGVVRLCSNTNYVQLEATDRVAQVSNTSFDAATFEIWGALSHGAAIVVITKSVILSPQEFVNYIKQQQISVLFLTTALFNQLAYSVPEAFSTLKHLLFGGEAVDPRAVKQVLDKGAPEQLLHVYGPTENTTFSSCYKVTQVAEVATNLPIGKPISNTQTYILDSQLQPVTIGVVGELHIGGDGLAIGYHKRPELTASKFIPNPFDKSKATKLYKTGDLARYLPDGNIEFLGRIDHQVKIRGYRIETGEIEAVLNSNSKVKETVVVAREDNPGDKRLVAYIVPETETRDSNNSELSTTQVESWQDIFNQQIYDELSEVTDPLFNTRGWISNYNNQPIPVEQMRVWADDIVSQVLANKPESVWEIGCGTGMLLFQIAPHTPKYLGTDISNVSLSYIKQQIEQQPEAKYGHVTLAQKRAEDMGDVGENSFDVVLLSSIVQYFPSVDYLMQVIEESIRVVKPGGMIFLGDIRSYPLMRAFHSSVQLEQATPSLSRQQLQQQIDGKMQQETELLVSPELFVALQEKHPEITQVQIRLQRGKEHNELRKYRYSVLLHIEAQPVSVIEAPVKSGAGISYEEIESYLRKFQPESICWSGIVNERVADDVGLVELLSQPESKLNVQQLRQKLESKETKSIDPERLHQLSSDLGYSLELCWSAESSPELIDAVFVRSELAAQGMVLTPLTQKSVVGGNWSSYGNNPLATQMAKQVIPELRQYLESKLPEYMQPSGYVVLSQLPLTPNGKVDRKALPAPDGELVSSQEYVAPQTETEEILVRIWQEVLGIKQVGIHDNFFEIGGDSIISIQIVARAQKAGIQLTTKQLFQNQTIAEQAAVAGVMARVEHQQGLVTGVVPLTPIQHWLCEQNLQEIHHFNQSLLLSVSPDINPELLSKVLEKILEHHDGLRLRFQKTGDGWQQINSSGFESIPFEVVDLSKDSETEQLRLLEEIATEKQASLNLSQGPIVRVVLFNFGREIEGRLLIIIHHLAVDGVSWRILLEDLFDGYQQLLRGEAIKLPEKTTAFQDWAVKLVEYGQSQKLEAEVDYWLNQPWSDVVSLPIDYPKIEADNTVGNTVNVTQTLSKEETTALLQEVPSAYNTQINDVLLTALVISLGEWMGTEKVLIDLEGHGREELFADVDLSRTVGWFTSMFPVHLQLSSGDIGEALKSVKEQLRKIPERGIGYGILLYMSGDEKMRTQLAALPAAEISFNYLGQFNNGSQSQQMRWQGGSESVGAHQSPKGKRAHWLDLNGVIVEGQLQITWTYSSCIHKDQTITNQAKKYIEVLQNLIAYCQSPENQGFTPSDFPAINLTQEELDALVLKLQADATNKNIESIYPLSPMQEGLLFHTNYAPNSGMYMEQILLTLSGEVNQENLKKSWEEVVQRHGVLRTMFVWEDRQQPLQVVRKQVDLPWSYLDWQNQSVTEPQHKLEALLNSDREEGFELDRAPLMRLTLVKVGNQTYKLLWSFHHILIDGWCLPIIIEEVLSYYKSANQGNRCHLPSVTPYQDYILWLQQQNQGEAEKFWRESLQGLTAPTPLVVERTPQQRQEYTSSYEQQTITLGQTTTIALESLVQKHRLTMASIVQAAWALLLSRYSGESDVVFGVTVSGRPANLSGVEKMVGLLINTLPLRVKVESDTKLIHWLEELNQKQLQLQTYSYSPLVEIKRLSEIPAGVPLFESILAFENYPVDRSLQQWNSNLKITELEGFTKTNYPLSITTGLTNEDLLLKIGYDSSYFASETIARMLGHLQTLLTAMATNPHLELGQLPLMTEAELDQILVSFHDTKKDYPTDKCIHQLFEAQVENNPDAIAVVFEEQQLTYSELNSKANQLAHYLQQLGVVPETLVGICIERSVEMVVGLLAILKAGGAYVPLDPNYPPSRLNYMVEDAQLSVVITQQKWLSHLPETIASVICLDTDEEIISQQSQENVENKVTASNLAYLIYTSGSTGKPKGVSIPHQGVVRLVCNTNYVQLEATDRVAQVSNSSFDAATFEIWGALLNGAVVVVMSQLILLSPPEFYNCIREKQITTLFLTTALFNQLAYSEPEIFSSLKNLLFGGEAVDPRAVKQVLENRPPERLLHLYGPTENTTYSTWYRVKEVAEGAINIPIGKPISNTQVHILDSNLQPVPIGVTGELYIGGDGLATGYHNRPELTAEKFISNPFDNSKSTKLYKTGDLVRYLPDGNIEFISRIDHQVKVRGYRIETGEIEATLTQHPSVKETVVLATEDNLGNQRLVAYLVRDAETIASSNPEVSETEQIKKLKQYLQERLPEYMIPSGFVMLSQLPLTPNGKVDRKALPVPDLASSVTTEYVAPETETQKALAQIWQEVLGVEKVGINDNFFDLGGHSLMATQVVSRVRQTLAMEIAVSTLFENPTIAQLAEILVE